jgi:acyl carrier protein
MKEKVTLEQISQTMRKFLFENYLFGYDENDFSNDSSFLDFGVLDSTGILELIVFIEGEFDIEVPDVEILPENLDSVNCVSRLVYKKIN